MNRCTDSAPIKRTAHSTSASLQMRMPRSDADQPWIWVGLFYDQLEEHTDPLICLSTSENRLSYRETRWCTDPMVTRWVAASVSVHRCGHFPNDPYRSRWPHDENSDQTRFHTSYTCRIQSISLTTRTAWLFVSATYIQLLNSTNPCGESNSTCWISPSAMPAWPLPTTSWRKMCSPPDRRSPHDTYDHFSVHFT